jgi:hypothetical protein
MHHNANIGGIMHIPASHTRVKILTEVVANVTCKVTYSIYYSSFHIIPWVDEYHLKCA